MDLGRAYRILELPSDASLDQVKQAYRELSLIWHPDRHSANVRVQARAQKKMTELNEAYEFLGTYLSPPHRNEPTGPGHNGHDKYSLVVCRVCGSKNRVPEHHPEAKMKCGKCGAELLPEYDRQQTQSHSLRSCGDGACTGIIGTNGRCGTCGRTFEEGERAYEERETSRPRGREGRYSQKKDYRGQKPSWTESVVALITENLLRAGYYPYGVIKRRYPAAARPVKWACLFLAVMGLVYGIYVSDAPTRNEPSNPLPQKPFIVDVGPRIPSYVRSAFAPNGEPWPAVSGYVKGYAKRSTGGLSTVTVDNSKNDSDVFVKLHTLETAQFQVVRVFFIKAGGRFTVRNVLPGNYDVRYRNLDSGALLKSEAFDLVEEQQDDGRTRFSNIEMTLFKVLHGNMKTYPISEEEFD
jgi:curved DNA-binding protein CbpA